MDKQVFKLIHDISHCCYRNSEPLDVFHSDGTIHTSIKFNDTEDKIIPDGDYIAIWLKPKVYAYFIKRHEGLCWHIVTKFSYNIYIYKV